MDCAEEVDVLKREIAPLVGGVENLAFDLLKCKMTLLKPPSGLTEQAVIQAVERTGMRAELWRELDEKSAEKTLWRKRGRTILSGCSGVLTAIGFAVHAALAGGIAAALGSEGMGIAHGVPWLTRVLYFLAIVSGGWYVAPKAWFALKRLRPDMNLLMTIAVAGAISIGEWFEAATVSFLFGLSLALESWSVGRARRAVEALLSLSPTQVRLLREDNREEVIAAEEVPVGSRFIVKPGERLPLDGLVLEGASQV
ncbi:MAG TPA: hypothetical protein VIH17_10395, partial [Candidatus Acidoferrales bacterium]